MRSLHIGNVANVAYANCKLLEQEGESVTLGFFNNAHVMSQPEWDDLPLDPGRFPDENNFFSENMEEEFKPLKIWVRRENLLSQNFPVIETIKKILPGKIRDIIRPIYFFLQRSVKFPYTVRISKSSGNNGLRSWLSRTENLSGISKRFGKKWYLDPRDFNMFHQPVNWLEKILPGHEISYSYSISPIYSMLMGDSPYVSVEIGTMRDIPFNNSITGRALALAYRLSPHVLITNPDVKKRASELGLERYSFCPHPVDEDRYTPAGRAEIKKLRNELEPEHRNRFIVFSPARQNWDLKGNDMIFRAFSRFLLSGADSVLLVPGWGQEIKRSKKLCRALGISDSVKWMKPLPEHLLIKYFHLSDMVLDQFRLGVFGLLTPKAMACGKTVMTFYDKDINSWAFSKEPPVLSASNEEEIYKNLLKMIKNRELLAEMGSMSRKWMLKYHNKQKTVEAILKAGQQALQYYIGGKN